MMSFSLLSALARAMFALWALLLCLTNIGSAVISAVKKRLRFTFLALALFAPVYFMWQVIFDFSLFGASDKAVGITAVMCSISWIYWFAALALLTFAAVLLLAYNIRYDKTFITPGTIKLYLDKIPCGICCWKENGRVLFSNICMNDLCVAITGSPLLNGNHFKAALGKEILNLDGKVWRFSSREIYIDGERLYEMIASDITAEYAKTQVLEKDKAELSRLNKELQEYYLSIDESVKRQEVLQAKINIHDEMNRLMLSTVAADKDNTGELDNIFSLWEQNALLLCMETEKRSLAQQESDIDALAKALGITLIWQEPLPSELSENRRGLFFSAAHEALINAVKHAKAKKMEISFEKTADIIRCKFTNDGKMPSGEVHFEGGLKNIAVSAKQQGAKIRVELDKNFTLVLSFKV